MRHGLIKAPGRPTVGCKQSPRKKTNLISKAQYFIANSMLSLILVCVSSYAEELPYSPGFFPPDSQVTTPIRSTLDDIFPNINHMSLNEEFNNYSVIEDEYPPPFWYRVQSWQTPGMLKETWRTGNLGSWMGVNGFYTIDIEQDGICEILVAGQTGYFVLSNMFNVLKYDPVLDSYEIYWTSGNTATKFSRIFPFRRESDSHLLINILFHTGYTYMLDMTTGLYLTYWRTDTERDYQQFYEDIDNDGVKEFVITGDGSTEIYDAETFEVELIIPYGYHFAAIGNVDEDSNIELVLSDGKIIEIVNGVAELEGDLYTPDNSFRVCLMDMDNDGMEEIIMFPGHDKLYAFDGDTQNQKWIYQGSGDNIDQLLPYDWDNDGNMDIIYSEVNNGITCIDATTLETKWHIPNWNFGIGGLAAGDGDGDGDDELFWATGYEATTPDHFLVYDMEDLTIEFQSTHVDYPFRAIEVADLNDDGEKEIITVSESSNSTFSGDGILQIYEIGTHQLLHRGDPFDFSGNTFWYEKDIEVADVDSDGQVEILLTMDYFGDSRILQLNGTTLEVETEYSVDDSHGQTGAVQAADLDGDGIIEIIGNFGEIGSDQRIIVYHSDGETIWDGTVACTNYMQHMRVADIDADDTLEIVFSGSDVGILEWETWESYRIPISIGARSFDIYQMDDDEPLEIVVGNYMGYIKIYDGLTLELETEYHIGTKDITAIKVADINQDGLIEIVVSHNDHELAIYNPRTDSIIWNYFIGNSTSAPNALVVEDYDGDGLIEVLAGSIASIYEFEFDTTFPPEITNSEHVFPGDTDNDGDVDEEDILPLGIYFLDEGNPRNPRSINWIPQEVDSWTSSPAEYADANGDGVVDEKDILPIAINWGAMHDGEGLQYKISPTDPILREHANSFRELHSSLSNAKGGASLKIRVLLEQILGIQHPNNTRLLPNYPNPYNANTTIHFELAGSQIVSLIVYDIRGRQIDTIINDEYYNPGIYKMTYNASEFSSGVYFCQLQLSGNSMIQKMIVVN